MRWIQTLGRSLWEGSFAICTRILCPSMFTPSIFLIAYSCVRAGEDIMLLLPPPGMSA
jgi:hypothetical protein